MNTFSKKWGPEKEDMSAFHIWCFTCKDKAAKNELRQNHLNHEVDYIRNSDGARYAFL